MKKERTNVGAMEISKRTGKPIICTEVKYNAKGDEDSIWVSYEEELLKTRMGMSPESHQLHPLQHFVDVLGANHPIGREGIIKIRYAYIGSPTVWRFDTAYHETIRFKVLTIEQIEARSVKTTLEELTRDDKEELIRILGRDLYTGRVDMDGKEIYRGDIIRWYTDSGSYIEEVIGAHTHFYEQDLTAKMDCKVIGTIYDKEHL